MWVTSSEVATALFTRFAAMLYRAGLGWFVRQRFLLLFHAAHRTGSPAHTLLEIVVREHVTDSYVVKSAFGSRLDWYLDIVATAQAEVQVGLRRRRVVAEPVSLKEKQRILAGSAREGLSHRLPLVRLRSVHAVRGCSRPSAEQHEVKRAQSRIARPPTC